MCKNLLYILALFFYSYFHKDQISREPKPQILPTELPIKNNNDATELYLSKILDLTPMTRPDQGTTQSKNSFPDPKNKKKKKIYQKRSLVN